MSDKTINRLQILDLLDEHLLQEMIDGGFVRMQDHPSEPLRILNYTAAAQYDRVWNDVTRQCRGLIFNSETNEVVARPWPKFFNYGEHEDLDHSSEVEVTDKLDGSLGILYPLSDGTWAIATRGSFTSDQAIAATEILHQKYSYWVPSSRHTYLFEILFPENRIVVNYGEQRDLVLLGLVEIRNGYPHSHKLAPGWNGPRAETFEASTLTQALEIPPRENAEGIVIRFRGDGLMLKMKQDDYIALHRILTGTNARNVWEIAAVLACQDLIDKPKHWGTYLGISVERAEEILSLGDDWLEGIPDEFHAWVDEVITEAMQQAAHMLGEGVALAEEIRDLEPRAQFEYVKSHVAASEILRLARTGSSDSLQLRCWREACPAPLLPFARSEDVA